MMEEVKLEVAEASDDTSDDEDRLHIDEINQGGGGGRGGGGLTRSLSLDSQANESSVSKKRRMSREDSNASDAIESLLMLGQQAVVSGGRLPYHHHPASTGSVQLGQQDGIFQRYSDPREQRLMVNYYQRMRERNNEASKKCR